MSNMSYVRHENTANDLSDVCSQWNDYDDIEEFSEYELKGRRQILKLAVMLYRALEDSDMIDQDGNLTEDAVEVYL